MKASAQHLIELANKHLNDPGVQMRTSASLCLKDAVHLQEQGRHCLAARRALKSLAYTVGVLSPTYAEAHRLIDMSVDAPQAAA